MGKVDTNTLLLIGLGAVAVYMFTRPKTPTLPVGYNPYATPAYNPYATGLPASQQYAGNPVAQDVSAGASALSSISDLLGNFF